MKNSLRLFYILRKIFALVILIPLFIPFLNAQSDKDFDKEITSVMMRATKFLSENVSENGGYVSHYLPDNTRRWGELEAYPTMIWTQDPGTVSMGNTFLDAYFTTKDEYYYLQAKKAADALVWGQLPCGGWNYFINFAGENSTLNWYNTIGKNAWRLEEFQHYYGNATFDDETTSGAAFFLLRFYLTKLDPAYIPPLDKAIDFVLKSQYPIGGWPQRFPLMHDFNKSGHPDYTSFYTFNDNVIWQNIKFLITCYATLNLDNKFHEGNDSQILDAIMRGMNFIMLIQQPKPFAGWGQQYTMDLQPAGARTYEPKSLDPQYTAANIEILIKCYETTGDKRYIERVPDAIKWLQNSKLKGTSKEGIYVYAKFVDPETGKALFTHRIGSNAFSGHYYVDNDSSNTVGHYHNFRFINLKKLEDDYQNILSKDKKDLIQNSPIIPNNNNANSLIAKYDEVTAYLEFPNDFEMQFPTDKKIIEKIVSSLDDKGRWLIKGLQTSNKYIGIPSKGEGNSTTREYMTTHVGDKFDTSPYKDSSDQEYISTGVYSYYMKTLINYLDKNKN